MTESSLDGVDVLALYECIDLSQPLNREAARSKLHGDVEIWMNELQVANLSGNCRVQVTHLNSSVHFGTHYDAPLHFFDAAKSIDQYEPARFLRPTVIVRLPHVAGEAVTPDQLAEALPKVSPGDSVFVCFGFGKHFTSPEYYDHPYLTKDAAHYLVGLGIGVFGSDTLSPDAPPGSRERSFDYPAHQAFLANDVLIIENLGRELERVAGERIMVLAPPLPIESADGAMTVPYALRPR